MDLMQMFRKVFPINVAMPERVARLSVGGFVLVMAYMEMFTGQTEFFATFFGAIGVGSGIIGHCPIFNIFNMKTSD